MDFGISLVFLFWAYRFCSFPGCLASKDYPSDLRLGTGGSGSPPWMWSKEKTPEIDEINLVVWNQLLYSSFFQTNSKLYKVVSLGTPQIQAMPKSNSFSATGRRWPSPGDPPWLLVGDETQLAMWWTHEGVAWIGRDSEWVLSLIICFWYSINIIGIRLRELTKDV